jgi:hypothetical protein
MACLEAAAGPNPISERNPWMAKVEMFFHSGRVLRKMHAVLGMLQFVEKAD